MTSTDPRELAQRRIGQTLANKWTIDRLVDVGGMAAVYAATHRNGKRVAIKMLHPYIATNADVRERFLREGYVANQVEHPGAVSILDDDVSSDGAPFLVMELLEGESLEGWLARAGGTLPVREVLAVADQILDVLAAFHARGVIHRDVKPGNVFVTKAGVVKVLDFGLARLRDPRFGGAPTASGIVLGTAAFMPPEQAQGKVDQVDARADVFAVGAVMFRALSGRNVHDAKAAMDRLLSAMRTPAPSLAAVAPHVPLPVVGVVDKALAFDKTGRWAGADEMRRAIRDVFASLGEHAGAPANEAPPVEADSGSIVIDVSFGDFLHEAPKSPR